MADFLNDKDYGDYFRLLEAELENKKPNIKTETVSCPRQTHKRKRKSFHFKPHVIPSVVIIVLALAVGISAITGSAKSKPSTKDNKQLSITKPSSNAPERVESNKIIRATADEKTAQPDSDIKSQFIAMVDLNTHKLVAARNPDQRTSPASTTKIMTALVACEQIKDFNDTFTMVAEITDPIYLAGATSAGFKVGEVLTMSDLLYGCILPSGGDASLGLAYKISGSEENFVKLMNEKAEALGLKDTHFTNVTGLYDKDHYTTAADMAMILEAAMHDPFCRKLLSTYQYTTSKTEQNPEGITLTSTLFSYMYGTEPETAQIDGGKTGYVNESGFCIASYGHSADDTPYICVTLHAATRWPAVFDQIEMYKKYAK